MLTFIRNVNVATAIVYGLIAALVAVGIAFAPAARAEEQIDCSSISAVELRLLCQSNEAREAGDEATLAAAAQDASEKVREAREDNARIVDALASVDEALADGQQALAADQSDLRERVARLEEARQAPLAIPAQSLAVPVAAPPPPVAPVYYDPEIRAYLGEARPGDAGVRVYSLASVARSESLRATHVCVEVRGEPVGVDGGEQIALDLDGNGSVDRAQRCARASGDLMVAGVPYRGHVTVRYVAPAGLVEYQGRRQEVFRARRTRDLLNTGYGVTDIHS